MITSEFKACMIAWDLKQKFDTNCSSNDFYFIEII